MSYCFAAGCEAEALPRLSSVFNLWGYALNGPFGLQIVGQSPT